MQCHFGSPVHPVLSLNSGEKTLGQIIILIGTKDIAESIQKLNSSTRSYVYILNKDSRLILSSENAPAPTQDFIDELSRQGTAFQTDMYNQTLMITRVTSSGNGWKYVLATPKSVYFQDNAKFMANFILIFLAYLVIGLFIVNLLTKRSYKPIKEIKDLIDKHNGGEENIRNGDCFEDGNYKDKNEFYTIKNTIINQFHTDKKLNEIIKGQMPIVRQSYLISLVKGLETNYSEAESKLPLMGINFISKYFLIAAVEFDMDSPFFMEGEQFAENNFSIAKAIVQKVGDELMHQKEICYFLNLGRNESVLIYNPHEKWLQYEAVDQFKKRMEELIAFALDSLKLNINVGVSTVHENIKSLPKCFDEAMKALERSKIMGNISLYIYDNSDKNLDYYYSTEMEYQIVSLLKRGSFLESKELINNIFIINRDSYSAMNLQTWNALYNDIAMTLARVMNAILLSQKKAPVTAEMLLDKLGKESSPDQAITFFTGYIDKIAGISENHVVRKTELLVNNIVEFINANANEKWLDLNFLSEKFEITPQYISNIFKKYQKETIKDYISKLKLQRAKELLATTNMSIGDISTSLGYVNELGIFRLFRKHENTTPGEYRAIHKKLQ